MTNRKEHNMIGMILKKVGDFLLPKAGKIIKGHLTNLSLGGVAVGMAYAGIESGNVLESFRVLIDLGERGWALVLEAKPHAIVLFCGVAAIAGWFRKAGYRLAKDQSSGA